MCIVSGRQMKQFEKQKEEFNGILHVSVRTKMPSYDNVMPHAQTHWLKTLTFTPLRFHKAVASDQHNYHNNIKIIKGGPCIHRIGPNHRIGPDRARNWPIP